jgi:CDP-diacylglycerol--glycerol-3-phosphate 3-phosphatidyltransferase
MNLANKLTLLRIIMIPFFLVFMLFNSIQNFYIAFIIFVLASVTDSLDGYIARNYNQVTKIGSIIDPLADKILTISAFIALTYLNLINPWLIIAIISREFIISAFRIIAASEGIVISASIYGKFKTIFQMILIGALLLSVNMPWINDLYISTILAWATLILTLVSLFEYIYKNIDVLKEKK